MHTSLEGGVLNTWTHRALGVALPALYTLIRPPILQLMAMGPGYCQSQVWAKG